MKNLILNLSLLSYNMLPYIINDSEWWMAFCTYYPSKLVFLPGKVHTQVFTIIYFYLWIVCRFKMNYWVFLWQLLLYDCVVSFFQCRTSPPCILLSTFLQPWIHIQKSLKHKITAITDFFFFCSSWYNGTVWCNKGLPEGTWYCQ